MLPSGPDSPFWTNDFDRFLKWRQDAIWKKIKEVTGITEASDLMAYEEAVE
jgi:hypothetical protein